MLCCVYCCQSIICHEMWARRFWGFIVLRARMFASSTHHFTTINSWVIFHTSFLIWKMGDYCFTLSISKSAQGPEESTAQTRWIQLSHCYKQSVLKRWMTSVLSMKFPHLSMLQIERGVMNWGFIFKWACSGSKFWKELHVWRENGKETNISLNIQPDPEL